MLRDGLTTNLNFTKYLQELSNEELDDINIKLNSCGYPGSKNVEELINLVELFIDCLLYTSPSPRDYAASRMPSSA